MNSLEAASHLATYVVNHVGDSKVADKMKDLFCDDSDYWILHGWAALQNAAYADVYPLTIEEKCRKFRWGNQTRF